MLAFLFVRAFVSVALAGTFVGAFCHLTGQSPADVVTHARDAYQQLHDSRASRPMNPHTVTPPTFVLNVLPETS